MEMKQVREEDDVLFVGEEPARKPKVKKEIKMEKELKVPGQV